MGTGGLRHGRLRPRPGDRDRGLRKAGAPNNAPAGELTAATGRSNSRLTAGPEESAGAGTQEISAALRVFRSTRDPEIMTRRLVDHAVKALRANRGLVGWMTESGRLSSVASGSQSRGEIPPSPFQLIESLGQEALTHGPVVIDHVAPASRETNGGHGTALVIPIQTDKSRPAVLYVVRSRPAGAFTATDIELAGVFAELMGLAVTLVNPLHERRGFGDQEDWAMLEDPSESRTSVGKETPAQGTYWRVRSEAVERELAAWHSIAQKMSAAPGLPDALHEVLLEVASLTGLPSALIYLYDEKSRKLRVAASTGMTPDFVAAVDNIQLGEGFSGRVFLTGDAITTENVSEDWRLSRKIVRTMSLQSYACIPLPGKGRILGTLGVIGPSPHRFESHEVEFLVSIGRQIGSLLEIAERAHGTWGRSQLMDSSMPGTGEMTDRQASVIRLLTAGLSPKEIAVQMRISDKTVRNHISQAYARAHVTDRGHLLLWAVKHGFVPSDAPELEGGL